MYHWLGWFKEKGGMLCTGLQLVALFAVMKRLLCGLKCVMLMNYMHGAIAIFILCGSESCCSSRGGSYPACPSATSPHNCSLQATICQHCFPQLESA